MTYFKMADFKPTFIFI